MNHRPASLYFAIVMSVFTASCVSSNSASNNQLPTYAIDDKALYAEIVAMDKQFFDAYNNCDISTLDLLISDNLEFYHDQGGLVDSKADLMNGLKTNICGEGKKVRRELIPNTTEVYRIKNFGAVQLSVHRFHNEVERSTSRPARVIQIWQEVGDTWKMTRVVSLH